MVIELPDLAGNEQMRRQILEASKSVQENAANKYVDDLVLITARDAIAYKTKNDYDIAFNRGAIWAIKLRQERLMQLATTDATKDKAKAQPIKPSRNHG